MNFLSYLSCRRTVTFITLENTISNKSGFKRPLQYTQIRITRFYFLQQLFPKWNSEGNDYTSVFLTLHHKLGYQFYCFRQKEKTKCQVISKNPFNKVHCKCNENNGQKKALKRIPLVKNKVCSRVFTCNFNFCRHENRKYTISCLTFSSP